MSLTSPLSKQSWERRGKKKGAQNFICRGDIPLYPRTLFCNGLSLWKSSLGTVLENPSFQIITPGSRKNFYSWLVRAGANRLRRPATHAASHDTQTDLIWKANWFLQLTLKLLLILLQSHSLSENVFFKGMFLHSKKMRDFEDMAAFKSWFKSGSL